MYDYINYPNFKLKEALVSLNEDIENHIEDMLDMVEIGSGAARELDSLKLSRFACYIAVQNADPSKKNVALGQVYFAIKTRQKELIEEEQVSVFNLLFI